jgi:GcrA cell cycle regulator
MRWTAEAVEDLKRLAREGRSASVIAAAVGAASRNAVIGKANRIGIKLNGGGGSSMLRKASAGMRRHPQIIPLSRPGNCEKREAAWTFSEAEVGEMRRVRFEEIRESACRWPLGDPRSGEFAYCGLKPVEGHSYCAGHCRMAYRPPNRGWRQSPREPLGMLALCNSWRRF